MDLGTLIALGIGVTSSVAGLGIGFWLQRKTMADLAAKVGFSRCKFGTDRDPAVDRVGYEGEIQGVRGRIVKIKSSPSTLDLGNRRSQSNADTVKSIGVAVEVPDLDIYLMTRAGVPPGEVYEVKLRHGFVDGDDGRLSDFHILLPPSDLSKLLVNDAAVRRLAGLTRAYSLVKFYKGWLTVETSDPDLVDVDFEHLLEVRRHLVE